MRRSTPAFVVVAGLVAACVGEGIDEDGDAPHVDSLSRFALVEELRIGSVDDPDVGFTQIGGTIQVEPEGIWVAERSDREIRLYDHSGAPVRTIGREGDGPGEFRSVSAFGLVGDTLWVRDGSARRVTLFTRDGELVETVSGLIEIPVTVEGDRPRTMTFSVYPGSLRPDGLFESTANTGLLANVSDSMIMLPTVLFDASGTVMDTLEVVPTRISRSARVLELSPGRTSFITIEPPPRDTVEWTTEVAGDTVAVAWHVPSGPEDASFDVVRRRGSDTLYHHRFGYDPRPVTEAYLDSLAAQRARGNRPSDSARIHQAVREEMRRPPFHAPITNARAGEDGGFWIALDDADGSIMPWLVIAPDGTVRGVAILPSMTTAFPRWTEGDTVWLAEIDELGVPWLVRYRLTSGGRP